MNFKSCVAALSLCLLPLCSQAGVVYQWRAMNGETPRGITLELEFDRSAVDSGTFSLSASADGYEGEPAPDTGLIGLRYTFTGSRDADLSWSRTDGFGSGFGMLDLSLSFDRGGFLSGFIYANDSMQHVMLGSTGRRFSVLDANSDGGMEGAGCEWGSELACSGAAGQIRRTDVPEPGSLALLGIGLLAVAGMGRKAAR